MITKERKDELTTLLDDFVTMEQSYKQFLQVVTDFEAKHSNFDSNISFLLYKLFDDVSSELSALEDELNDK